MPDGFNRWTHHPLVPGSTVRVVTSRSMPVAEAVRALYRANWGEPIRRAAFGDDVQIEVEKWVAEGVTIYATVGTSNMPALHHRHHRVEFFTGLLPERDDVARALAHLAHYAVTGEDQVQHGDTVPMPGPLW